MIILASNSPRRKEILQGGGYQFTVTCADFDEISQQKDPIKLAQEFAKGKAESVFYALENKTDAIVLGADTVVCYEGKILGKPKDFYPKSYLRVEN